MIRKLYRERVVSRWEIIEKETIDEIIFRTVKVRNRLILELMARGGMRIGEVLKVRLHPHSGWPQVAPQRGALVSGKLPGPFSDGLIQL